MDIEANKDKAYQCFESAKTAFAAGDAEEAERLLLEAERLYSSKLSKQLLEQVQAARSSGAGCEAPTSSRREEPRQAAPKPEWTPEQLTDVRHILKLSESKASLYEILGVPEDATESDIQKEVRIWAMKVHPDKNPAPGATEAMIAVNCAAAVLMVPDKRLEYDRRRKQKLEPDSTPEEMFNSFFGPDSLAKLQKMMPWLVMGAGAVIAGAGAYALYSTRQNQEGSEQSSSAENEEKRKRKQMK